jgi:Na+-translocating ferredoxin:NAD+ oxidoreductase RNF subunit RnfB
MVQEIAIGIGIPLSLGLLFASVIAFAYKKFRVVEDPRIDQVEEMLPHANCGACGKPGCRAFAEAIVKGEELPSGCTVSTLEGISRIANLLGVEAGTVEKRVARLLCAGGKQEAHSMAAYRGGLHTGRGQTVVGGGGQACSWGCLGLGDCVQACNFGAMFMSDDGLPVVLTDKCTACGDCVRACPKGLFEIMPISQKLIVQCKSLLEGDLAESKCSVACTACGRCVADAPPGVIEIKDHLAVVNYGLNALTSPDAVRRCPTGAIVWVDGQQFADAGKSNLPLGRVETY